MKILNLALITALPFALVWFWAWVFTLDLADSYSLAASISAVYSVAITAIVALVTAIDFFQEK